MIRNVVVGRLRDGVAPEEVEPALQALRDLKVAGVEFTLVAGVDLGLRDGAASYALTCDFVDEDAYRVYDADPEHNRIRREMFAPLSASIERGAVPASLTPRPGRVPPDQLGHRGQGRQPARGGRGDRHVRWRRKRAPCSRR